jgi:DNA-binding transcriptional LysR family regulator
MGNQQSATVRSAEPMVDPPARSDPEDGAVGVEFRQLRTFLAIAEELHFGRAAQRLHLAQSSVSEQLRRLERELGVTLVTRSSHRVELSEAGRAFETAARQLLADVDRAAQLARDVADGRQGRLNIGFNPVAAMSVVPAALIQLQSDHPDVTVDLRELMTGPQLTALRNYDIDIGFLYGRPPPGYNHRYVQELSVIAVVSDTHPWAGRTQVRFADLGAQPCVLPSPAVSPGLHDAIIRAAARADVDLHVTDIVDDANAIAVRARTSHVLAFASAARTPHARSAGLATVSIVDPTPTVSMYVAWTRRTRLVEAFLSSLERSYA